MSDSTGILDLSGLENEYEIIGEMNVKDHSRAFIATRKDASGKRKDDHSRVLITVNATPEGDEGNALSHYAADTQLLARLGHRRLIPVIEGGWVGKDSFAVVSERIADPSLAAVLARSGERFSNPRIAAILREVNGLLEWAREQRIIHRALTAETIFLEPQTDRVRASFVVAAIPRRPRSDVDADARTIARLAIAMLIGNGDRPLLTAATLADSRPDLPDRVIEVTKAVLDDKETADGTNIPAYLALIGMADPIAAEESELERLRAELVEEQRVERGKLADERTRFEQTMAGERAGFAAERHAFLAGVAQERAELVARREALEKEAADRIGAFERIAAHDRQLIDDLRSEIRRAGELEIEKKRLTALEDIHDADADTASVLDQDRLMALPFVLPIMAPLAELGFNDDRPWLPDEDGMIPQTREHTFIDSQPAPVATLAATDRPSHPRARILPFALVGLLVVIVLGAAALRYRSTTVATTAPASVNALTRTTATPVAALPVVAPQYAVPLPPAGAVVDSLIGKRIQPLDSAAAAAQLVRHTRRIGRDSTPRPDTVSSGDSLSQVRARRDTTRKPDTTQVSQP